MLKTIYTIGKEISKGRDIWKDIIETKELKEFLIKITNKHTKDAYSLNQDLVLVSLYSLTPPLRDEPKTLKFTKNKRTKAIGYF